MVFRWFLPKEGGGQVRRYLRFRKSILNRFVQSNDRFPCPPVPLFDFVHHDDAVDAANVQERDSDSWRISDDRVIGGFSESAATLIRSHSDHQRYLNGEERIVPANNTKSDDDPSQSTFQPFIRWKGNLDTTIGLRSMAQRSGFAALRSPTFPLDGANLRGLYEALEIVCRSDGRLYTVNLKVSTSIPDDIYQGHIKSVSVNFDNAANLAGPFETFLLPFSEFRLTSMGRDREVFRELDDNICIESIGVALMDGKDGDFQFDLARVRAVNVLEGRVYEEEGDEADD